MEELDFCVKQINSIVRRPRNAAWHVENLCYEKEYVIAIVLEGEASYTVAGQKVFAKKNDVLLFAPKTERSGSSDKQKPWGFICINFSLEAGTAVQDLLNKTILIAPHASESIRSKFVEAAYAWTGQNPLYKVKCKNLVSDILYETILSHLPHNYVPHIKKLEAARTYIQAHFREDISVEALAGSQGLSVSYFRKLFKSAYGMAPMQYIISLRISSARDFLLSGEVNVTQAALLSGFDDIYYFSTLFKKQTGMAPSQVRHK